METAVVLLDVDCSFTRHATRLTHNRTCSKALTLRHYSHSSPPPTTPTLIHLGSARASSTAPPNASWRKSVFPPRCTIAIANVADRFCPARQLNNTHGGRCPSSNRQATSQCL